MESKIYPAIIEIIRECQAIEKDKRNTQQGFNFRGIDDVYNSLHGIFAKHGVFCTTEVIEDKSEERQTRTGGTLIYRIFKTKYSFHATDGSCISSTIVSEGMDSGDKAANKALAVGHKYAILQMLLVPTGDDPDAESHGDLSPRSTPAAPQTLPDAQKPAAIPVSVGAGTGTKPEKQPPAIVEGILSKVTEATTKTGKQRWGLTIDNITYGTFDKEIGKSATEIEGHRVQLAWEFDSTKKWKNVVDLKVIPDGPQPADQAPGQGTDQPPLPF